MTTPVGLLPFPKPCPRFLLGALSPGVSCRSQTTSVTQEVPSAFPPSLAPSCICSASLCLEPSRFHLSGASRGHPLPAHSIKLTSSVLPETISFNTQGIPLAETSQDLQNKSVFTFSPSEDKHIGLPATVSSGPKSLDFSLIQSARENSTQHLRCGQSG